MIFRIFCEKFTMSWEGLNLLKTTIFSIHPKMKEVADDNFSFDEYVGKFSEEVENIVGKGEFSSLRAISPFPAVFSKDLYRRQVNNQGLFGKGLRQLTKATN